MCSKCKLCRLPRKVPPCSTKGSGDLPSLVFCEDLSNKVGAVGTWTPNSSETSSHVLTWLYLF